MNKQTKQSGFAHLGIVVIILSVALIGTLGFVFYNNFLNNKNKVSRADTSSKAGNEISNNIGDSANIKPIDNNNNPNEGYLVLSDWGVKLKLPANLGENEITYHKASGVLAGSTDETYGFSTKRVEVFGGRCVEGTEDGPVVYMGELIRTKQSDRDDGQYTHIAAHIGDYYYYVFNNGSPCSEKGDEFQYADGIMLKDFLLGVEKE